MAFQTDTKYVGRQGNIIAYERLGDYLIRTVPKQAANSIRTAAAFGKAASRAKTLRGLLRPVISNPKDKQMQNRLTAAMRLFLAESRDMVDTPQNSLAGFRFNPDLALADCLLFPIDISDYEGGQISVGIPAIRPIEAIAAPAGTENVRLTMMAAAFHPEDGGHLAGEPQVVVIPYTDSMQDPVNLQLDCAAEPGSMLVIAASVDFLSVNQGVEQLSRAAAEIITTIPIS